MIKLGKLALDGSPRVAVSFTDRDDAASLEAAVRNGVDIAELRIDQFAAADPRSVTAVARRFAAALPTIATIRHSQEGGHWNGSEDARVDLYRALLPIADAIDVELRFPQTIAALLPEVRAHQRLLILSHHDFGTTPSLEQLRDIIARAKSAGADIIKVAAQVNGPRDLRTLAQLLLKHPEDNLVIIGMGSQGLVTRAFFPALGSLLTFAANGDRASAPGQLPYRQTIALLQQVYPSS